MGADMLRRARSAYDLSAESLPAAPEEFAAWYRATAFAHPLYEHDLYSFVASEATGASWSGSSGWSVPEKPRSTISSHWHRSERAAK